MGFQGGLTCFPKAAYQESLIPHEEMSQTDVERDARGSGRDAKQSGSVRPTCGWGRSEPLELGAYGLGKAW